MGVIPMDMSVQQIQSQLVDQLRPSSETASLDAQVLLAYYLKKPRSWILAHPETSLTPDQYKEICMGIDRLMHGEPLPYVIGQWEFYGLDFQLTRDVLIPRPETELLVERAINWLKFHPQQRKAIDVGTGSGCIGVSLAKYIPDLHMVLTDISSQALVVAQDNAVKHGVSARMVFKQTDVMDGIAGPFDLICANLPYIPTNLLMTLPVVKKEPRTSLDGGISGTELIRKLIEQSRGQLISGGLLLLEIEASQASDLKALAQELYPFSRVDILKDLADRDRCLEIERPNLLVHICSRDEWRQAQRMARYEDSSLEQAGFIHCSQPEQVLEVANRFYEGFSDLVLLWLIPDRLTGDIRWENVDDILFPHLYGSINLNAVKSITDFVPDQDGVFRNLRLPG
jgi:release factor glutamine methyltransferase